MMYGKFTRVPADALEQPVHPAERLFVGLSGESDHIASLSLSLYAVLCLSAQAVALAWLRCRSVPVTPIIGARKVSQLSDNLASLDLELSAEQVNALDEASRVDLGFPYDFYNRELVRSFRYGGMAEQIAA